MWANPQYIKLYNRLWRNRIIFQTLNG
jgi:hypothetical protein